MTSAEIEKLRRRAEQADRQRDRMVERVHETEQRIQRALKDAEAAWDNARLMLRTPRTGP